MDAERFAPPGEYRRARPARVPVTRPSNGTPIAPAPKRRPTMLRDCPPDAKATLALIALSALCILGWLADLGL